MTRKVAFVLGLTLVLSALFIVLRDGLAPGEAGRVRAFELPDTSGRKVGPQTYDGQVVLVNFWATYCAPCIEEMPSLEKVWQTHRSEGLVVLAVSIDEGMEPVIDFQKKHSLSFPVALDADRRIATAWGTEKVPETYIVDRRGRVTTKVMGAVDWTSPEYLSIIEGLLRQRT